MAAPQGRRVEEDRDREDDIALLAYAAIVWRRRRLVLALAFVLGSIALVYSLLQPNVYEAAATIVTQQEGPGAPGRDLLIAILKSRTMAEDVAERFHLKERFNAPYLGDAIQTLQSQTDVSVTKEGVIVVKVETTDPQLSADIANYDVSALDKMVARFGTTAAGRRRGLIAARLKVTEEELSRAEEALLRLEELSRAVAPQEQAKGIVESAARVKGETITAGVELEVLRSRAIESNADAIRTAAPSVVARDEACDDLGVPLGEMAGLGPNLARLARDLKAQEAVYTLLAQQLEQARIAEAHEAPAIQALDRAVPAERKSGPKVAVNVLLAAVAGGAAAVFLAFILESAKRLAASRARRAKDVIDLELDADGVHARPPEQVPRQTPVRAGEPQVEPGGRLGKKARRPVQQG